MLEGSPGVGKTSLIVALGKFSGHRVVRINLSEQVSSSHYIYSSIFVSFCFWFLFLMCCNVSLHNSIINYLLVQTDIQDLLGSDIPVDSDDGIKFAWSDGILLQVRMSYSEGIICLLLHQMFIFFLLLQALKEGCWVLLDELNLAPQSVLEVLS